MLPNETRNLTERAVARAGELRKEMSASERLLWSWIRRERLGFRFRKQAPIGRFFLDFYCPEARLCVEVDGEHHSGQTEYDALRDAELAKMGILTLRVPSLELFERSPALDRWLDTIYERCCERAGRRPDRVR